MAFTVYPNAIDSTDQLPIAVDNITPVKAEVVNRQRDAILAIESELGTDPSGTFTTVRARLDALDAEIADIYERIEAIEAGGGGTVRVQHEGATVVLTTSTLNFAGTGVNVLNMGSNTAEIFINGGGDVIEQKQEKLTVPSDGYTFFNLSITPQDSTAVQMFVNGVKQDYGIDYTAIGSVVTYSGAVPLKTTDVVEFWYIVSGSVSSGGGETLAQTLAIGNQTGGHGIEFSAGDTITSATGTVTVANNLDVTGKLTVAGLIDPTGIVLNEQASVPATPIAGKGIIWVDSSVSPNRLVFTPEDGTNTHLSGAGTTNDLPTVLSNGNTTGGTSIVVTSGDAVSFGNSPATTGAIRLSNTQAIYSHNSGGSGNLSALFVGSDDHCYIGNGTASSDSVIRFTNSAYIFSGATTVGSQTDGFKVTGTTLTWNQAASSPSFGQDQKTSDAAANDLTITSQFAFSGAVTNKNAGHLVLQGGRAATGGTHGAVKFYSASTQLGQLGATSSDFIRFGDTPSTSGTIRLSNNTGIFVRNATNLGNVQAVIVDGSNVVTLGDGTNSPLTQILSSTTVRGAVGATVVFQLSVGGTDYIQFGSAPATTGSIRLSHNSSIDGRNSTNGSDRTIVRWGVIADSLQIGDTTNTATYFYGQQIVLNNGSANMAALAGGAGDFIQFGATPATTGALRLGIASGVVWAEGVAAPITYQETKTTDAAPQDITIQPQFAFASATAANRTPGSLIAALGSPTNGGTTEARFQVNRGGSHQVSMGNYVSSSLAAIWVGPGLTPNSTNFSFLGDGSTQTQLNVDTGGTLFFTTGGTALNGISVSASTVQWWETQTQATLTIKQRTTDDVTNDLTISGQFAKSGAVTNKNGGNLILDGGRKAAGGISGNVYVAKNSADGNVILFNSSTLGGAQGVLALGVVNTQPSSSAANQVLIWNNSGSLAMQADGSFSLSIGTSEKLSVNSTLFNVKADFSHSTGRVFTKAPAVSTGTSVTITIVAAGGFTASKSHIVVALVHADDGTDRAEFRITATFKSDGSGNAAGLNTPVVDTLSNTAGAATWTATVAVSANALVMNGTSTTAGTNFTTNASFSRAA